jgi:hypothetical protein
VREAGDGSSDVAQLDDDPRDGLREHRSPPLQVFRSLGILGPVLICQRTPPIWKPC